MWENFLLLYRHRYRLGDGIFWYHDSENIVGGKRAMDMTIADMWREVDREIDGSSIAWLLHTDTVVSQLFVRPFSLDTEAILLIESDMDTFFVDSTEGEDDDDLMWRFVDVIGDSGHSLRVLIKLTIVVMIVIGIVCRWCDDLVDTIFHFLRICDIVKYYFP